MNLHLEIHSISFDETKSWKHYSEEISQSSQGLICNENDYIHFYLTSNTEIAVDSVCLFLGELEFQLLRYDSSKEGFSYIPNLNNLYLEDSNFLRRPHSGPISAMYPKIFLNNIGLVPILIFDNSQDKTLLKGQVEVVSDKVDEDDLNDLFDYLQKKEISYWNPFSLSILNNDSEYLRQSFFILLTEIDNDLNRIQSIVPDFVNYPLSSLTPAYFDKMFEESDIIDDNSFSWLLNNLDSLSRTTSLAEENNVRIKNTNYNIRNILSKNLVEKLDIYENQIIVGFLLDLTEVLSDQLSNIQKRISDLKEQKASRKHVSLVLIQEIKFYDRQFRFVNDLQQRTRLISTNLNETFQVNFPLSFPPKADNRFQSKIHYSTIYDILCKWYELKETSWGTNDLFSGIRTLDKLFELYVFFKIKDIIFDFGYSLVTNSLINRSDSFEKSKHAGVYIFKKEDKIIKLFYEKLPDELCTQIPTSEGRDLCPDYIIEFVNNGESSYFILDAKFKKIKNLKSFTFREVIPKYLHGIGKKNGESADILGLVILYPEDKEINKPITNFHKKDYGLSGKFQVAPIICGIEVALNGKESYLSSILRKHLR